MHKLKIIHSGNSLGVPLPDDVLSSISKNRGDTLCLIKSNEGYILTTYDPELEKQLHSAGKVMNKV